jgi:alkyl sulfatase BDS1-like metallo-beta-lactamase superfamily hydrolase
VKIVLPLGTWTHRPIAASRSRKSGGCSASHPVSASRRELFQEHVGEGLPVSAVIYSHTHGDHFGGVRGVMTDEDVASGRVEIIAPDGFMQFTISENVYAGNAMNRRLFYQYGLLLPASPHGFVTQGLGHRVPAGATGLFAPTRLVSDPIEEFEVDGVLMIFQNENQAGKDLLADIFEQLGYQAECGGHRNSYLAAAYELRSGIPQGAVVSASPDVVRAMSTELFLNFLGIKMDSARAEGLSFTMNLVTPDTGETFLVELSNATLNNLAGYTVRGRRPDADDQPRRSRAGDGGEATLDALLADGTATGRGRSASSASWRR